jgi:hypothetical protein
MNLRALSMFAIVVTVVGCRGGDDRPPAPEPVPEAIAEPTARPAPEPALSPAIARSFGPGLELRRPIVDGRLTLVPIIATRATPQIRYITLREGLTSGIVEVTEMGGLVVDTLRVHNNSARPLFVLQGELLVDGMQDRVTAQTVIIAAGESSPLPVRCVEHSRSDGGPEFHTGAAIVELSLRRTLAHEMQSEVWAEVDAINRRLHLEPPTRTYRLAADVQAQGDNAARRARIFEQLARREEHAQMVGLAVAIDGKLLAVDQFTTPELYHQLESMLLASYVVGTEGRAPDRPALSADAILRFVASPFAVINAASTIVLAERSNAEKLASQPAQDEGGDD